MTNGEKKPFIITEEMVENATSYIPMSEKMAWVTVMARDCIEPVEIDVMNVQANQILALPSMYQEDTHKKHLFLMQKFLSDYFHLQVPDIFTSEHYDEYAKYQPLMQLERLKTSCENKENKSKIFDLLYDYKNLEKYLNNEIHKVVSAHNDGLSRFLAGISVMADSETIKKMVAEVEKTVKQVEKKQTEPKKKKAPASAEMKKKTETAEGKK